MRAYVPRRTLIALCVCANQLATTTASADTLGKAPANLAPAPVSASRSGAGSTMRAIGIGLTGLGSAVAGVSVGFFAMGANHSSDDHGDYAPAGLAYGLIFGLGSLPLGLPGVALWGVGDSNKLRATEAGRPQMRPAGLSHSLGATMTVLGTAAATASFVLLAFASGDHHPFPNAFARDLGWGIGLGAARLGLLGPGIVLWSFKPTTATVGGGPAGTMGASVRWQF